MSERKGKRGLQYLVTAPKAAWWVMPAPKVKIAVREMQNIIADTWEKIGPAPDIDCDKI